MSLLRREPREVYRVYDEGEFLAGSDRESGTPAAQPREAARQVQSSGLGSRYRAANLRRVAAATLLAGAVGGLCGLIALSSLRPASRTGRRPAAAELVPVGSPSTRARSGASGSMQSSRGPGSPGAEARSAHGDLSGAARVRWASASGAVGMLADAVHAVDAAAPAASVSTDPRTVEQTEFGFEY